MLIKAGKSLAFWALGAAFVCASFSNSLFEIFSSAFLILSLALIAKEKRLDVFKSAFGVAAGLYFLAVLMTLTQSAYPAESLRGIFRVLRCVLMSFSAIYLVDNEEKFKKIFYIFALSALLIAADALVQGIFGIEFLRSRSMTPYLGQHERVTGPFSHANDLAAYLSMVIFLFLGMIFREWRSRTWKESVFFLSGLTALGICFLWTYSRGAWVAAGIACVLLAVLQRSRVMIFAILVTAVGLFFLSPAPLRTRIASFGDISDGTMKERRFLWTEALEMTAERPWLGYGINTYSKVEPHFKSKEHYTNNQYAHNGYLQIAAETGWVGLVAFLAVMAAFFMAVFKAPWRHSDFLSAATLSLALGILSFLLHSATDTNLHSMRLVSLLWLAMGLAMAAKRLQEKTPR